MNYERLKRIIRTLNNRFFALDEVQDIDTASRVVRHGTSEPMTAGFDELSFVQPGLLLSPAISLSYGFHAVHQVLPHPVFRSIPLNVGERMIEMDRPRLAIQA
jgi:hypothetical protein